jgi:hypothetical protein
MVHHHRGDLRTLVSRRVRGAHFPAFRGYSELAGRLGVVLRSLSQPSPVGYQDPVAAKAADPSPDPPSLPHRQLWRDHATVGQRRGHALSETALANTRSCAPRRDTTPRRLSPTRSIVTVSQPKRNAFLITVSGAEAWFGSRSPYPTSTPRSCGARRTTTTPRTATSSTSCSTGGVFPSASTGLVTYVVVRSGPADLGKWITERRNVLEDFKRIYGEEPDGPAEAVSIGIDSKDTKSRAESYMGAILFRKP